MIALGAMEQGKLLVFYRMQHVRVVMVESISNAHDVGEQDEHRSEARNLISKHYMNA